jgi:dolichol-phosphate mannosyltransferase
MSARRRLLIVLPTYNERANIERLVTHLVEVDGVTRIIIADDESPDGTGTIADDLARRLPGRIHVLHRTGARGYGMACREAMALALQSGADFIVQMDADGSHDPSFIPEMVAAAAGADVTIGSRYVPGGTVVNWPWRRRVLSRFANFYVRALLALPTRDCTSGFRCWRPGALAAALRYRTRSNGYAFLVEMLWAAVSAGASVAEVPIAFVEREHGVSKMSRRVIAESAIVPWRLRRQPAASSLAPRESSIT